MARSMSATRATRRSCRAGAFVDARHARTCSETGSVVAGGGLALASPREARASSERETTTRIPWYSTSASPHSRATRANARMVSRYSGPSALVCPTVHMCIHAFTSCQVSVYPAVHVSGDGSVYEHLAVRPPAIWCHATPVATLAVCVLSALCLPCRSLPARQPGSQEATTWAACTTPLALAARLEALARRLAPLVRPAALAVPDRAESLAVAQREPLAPRARRAVRASSRRTARCATHGTPRPSLADRASLRGVTPRWAWRMGASRARVGRDRTPTAAAGRGLRRWPTVPACLTSSPLSLVAWPSAARTIAAFRRTPLARAWPDGPRTRAATRPSRRSSRPPTALRRRPACGSRAGRRSVRSGASPRTRISNQRVVTLWLPPHPSPASASPDALLMQLLSDALDGGSGALRRAHAGLRSLDRLAREAPAGEHQR